MKKNRQLELEHLYQYNQEIPKMFFDKIRNFKSKIYKKKNTFISDFDGKVVEYDTECKNVKGYVFEKNLDWRKYYKSYYCNYESDGGLFNPKSMEIRYENSKFGDEYFLSIRSEHFFTFIKDFDVKIFNELKKVINNFIKNTIVFFKEASEKINTNPTFYLKKVRKMKNHEQSKIENNNLIIMTYSNELIFKINYKTNIIKFYYDEKLKLEMNLNNYKFNDNFNDILMINSLIFDINNFLF